MTKQGGRVLAVAVDPPAKSAEIAAKAKLAFPILADESRAATRAFGVLHENGSPTNEDIPVPSIFLINTDGRILWRRIAARIQDRPDPQDVVRAIHQFLDDRH